MATIHPGRYTAEVDGDFVVFLIGMRLNRPWKLHHWWPVFAGMRRMLAELARHPERGLARATSASGTRPTSSRPGGTRPSTAACPGSGWPPPAATSPSPGGASRRPSGSVPWRRTRWRPRLELGIPPDAAVAVLRGDALEAARIGVVMGSTGLAVDDIRAGDHRRARQEAVPPPRPRQPGTPNVTVAAHWTRTRAPRPRRPARRSVRVAVGDPVTAAPTKRRADRVTRDRGVRAATPRALGTGPAWPSAGHPSFRRRSGGRSFPTS
jgi:hypothetical protein